MLSVDDKLLIALLSCEKPVSMRKFQYEMYMWQLANTDYEFSYKISTDFSSKTLKAYMVDLIDEGYLQATDGKTLVITGKGEDRLSQFLITEAEWLSLSSIFSIFEGLSEGEMLLVCLTNMFVFDTLKLNGAEGLRTQENRIKNTLKTLCEDYSEENFNAAIRIGRMVREAL